MFHRSIRVVTLGLLALLDRYVVSLGQTDPERLEAAPRAEIEHDIIRPVFQEPRIHFAVSCAAYDCPQLREEAYVGDRLDEQLDDQVRRLMAVDRHFRIEGGDPPVLRVNRVLDWFSEDFGGEDGIPDFFAPYLSGDERALIEESDVKVEFLHSDWTLNDVHAEPEDR